MSEYLILIYEDEKAYAAADAGSTERAMEAHNRFAEQVAEHGGKILGGEALQPTATATSVRGDVVTDGPFVETKEALGGYYLIEAADLDQALGDRQALPGAVRRRRGPPDHGASRTGDRPEADVPADVEAAVADAHRREWAFVLAATVRVAGDLDLAEECVQDAYVAALDTWRRAGRAGQPGRLADHHRPAPGARRAAPRPDAARASCRCSSSRRSTADADPRTLADREDEVIPDDRLRLIFTCCHPALAREAQVALTLRLVCGLTTAEIAPAFLVTEPTMAARITRAKKKIAAARIPYRVPGAAELPDRLDAVLTVVHLLFTTGHTAPAAPTWSAPTWSSGRSTWPGCCAR